MLLLFFVYCSGDHRDLHVLTHSFPTRRSSDLGAVRRTRRRRGSRRVCGVPARTAGSHPRRVGSKGEARKRASSPSTRDHRASPRSAHYGSQRSHRSEEHTSELQSLMRISYAVFCLKKTNRLNKYSKQSN